MNRADQAPEPSMEELLASIRLIISDADRKSPLASDGASRRPSSAAGTDTPPGDEVLDLTDEIVSLEEHRGLPYSTVQAIGEVTVPISASVHGIRESGPSSPAPNSAAPSRLALTSEAKAPATQRPLWSRRGLPLPNASAEQSAKPNQERTQARIAKAGHEDIQMPVPEQGPVALVSPAERIEKPVAPTSENALNSTPISRLEGSDEASVTEIAQRLARSAVESMEGDELATAQQVKFENLDRGSRADVTEKFADAIERGSRSLGKPMLPSLLDEVFRQNLRQETAGAAAEAAIESPPAENVAARQEQPPAPQPAPSKSREPSHIPQARVVQPSFPTAQAGAPIQALVPAQAPAPPQPARTLEDAVREMLRPLLVQWLNENMPRILESAIREEIAARGLIPGTDR